MTKQEDIVGKALLRDIRRLRRALTGYQYSYSRCKEIGDKLDRSQDEEVEFEAFTSRFARLADLLTQKLLKGLFILLNEDLPTFIDRANYAEKLGLTTSAQTLRLIRELRNRIAHEYAEDDIGEIYTLVFKVHDDLVLCIQSSMTYVQEVLMKLGISEEE